MVAESAARHEPNWTYSELAALGDENRYELYDGDILEMTSPTLLHQQIIGNLYLLLKTWAREHNAGRVYVSPVDLYVSETRCFIPDLCFFRRERYETEIIEREDGRCLIAPPDLIVEVVSPSTARRDRIDKAAQYAEFGVLRYWLLDPLEKSLQVLVLSDGRYTIEAGYTDENTFESAAFPGLSFTLADLFEQ